MSITNKVSREARSVAESIHNQLLRIAGEPLAFSLVIYTEGRASYISNCRREEAIPELRRFFEYLESGAPDIPAHELAS